MMFLYLSLIIGSLWFGIIQAKKLYLRVDFYKQFLDFLKAYSSNLSYKQDSISDLIESYKKKHNNDFIRFITDIKLNKFVQLEYLKSEEAEEVKNIVAILGSSDIYTEEQKIKSIVNEVEEKHFECKNIKEKYSGLSIKLSFLIGVLLVILLL